MRNKLRKLIEEYKKEAGCDSFAIRDLLTDLWHIGDEVKVNIQDRVDAAYEVFEEEVAEVPVGEVDTEVYLRDIDA